MNVDSQYIKPSTLIINANTNHKQIAFTYDSGFEDNETYQILDVLKKHKVKATFFLTGIWVEKFPEVAKRIAYEGHEIGNHSYDHPDMVNISHDEIVKNILKGEDAIKKIIGVTPCPLFREPFGSWNKKVFKAVGAAGYKYSIYWSIDTIDWQHPTTRVIVNRILRKAQGGDIVLMHISGNHTAEATDIAIRNLKAFGFKFVTVGELLKH
ncbi:polysaccharide deacetylase family protein [Clostridium aestuarii]|uniref:Polysaccharide deacetylase family protein n=1 Tax=Clostridium aestuarii TaxID=338193 RepID=A0ABT4D2B3_9CLOT|nr:polysaccharide deacetylase family protein [Clostridium aestuarii]MCY6485384.1 polysaccharide deacetylase family protein [Clostridium aestuarii]